MKHILNHTSTAWLFLLLTLLAVSCGRPNLDELSPASFPTNPDVFADGFSAGLQYVAFGTSDVTAFDVDMEVVYSGEASMRFSIPDDGSPRGSYAGGVFLDEVGRDLSEYDALTFWAKGSQAANIDLIGFGNNLGSSTFLTEMYSIPINTNWKKYMIPIADASKLTQERGLLSFTETPENGKGYTFWLDEVKFEKLGTIARKRPIIQGGIDATITAETGDSVSISNVSLAFNLPTGVDDTVSTAAAFLAYTSSDNSVATVDQYGMIRVVDAGTATITASLDGVDAVGSLTVNSSGEAVKPTSIAPAPTELADSVISLFSNVYDNVPVDVWNTFWQFSTALNEDIQVNGDDIIRYKNLNFVGIEFTSNQIDASDMTHFHIDIWTPDPTDLPASFTVELIDFGPNGTFDGGDDSGGGVTTTRPTLQTGEWVSLDLKLSDFTGLANRTNMAQLVLSGDLPNVYIDNVYFYNDGSGTGSGGGGGGGGGGTTPTTGAPVPSANPADVISIFSDTYTNVSGTNLNPDWGQATAVSEVNIGGNNTLLYAGLNYQGTEFASAIDASGMTHLHIDFWTANSTQLNAFLISDGPVETPKSLTVPTSGWSSIDIPLADFSPVDLAAVIQMKFDGDGDIYLDNIYFVNDPSLGSGGGGGGGSAPTTAAPTPTYPAADVISIFSDAYTNVAGTNLNPDWGQNTVMSETLIAGNNTILYKGLNYQGTELASGQDVSGMTYLHLDFWTSNSTMLNVFIISPGPVETGYALTVPTSGWSSVDIPLTEFSPVDLADVFQFKFDGDGDIYIDNLLFRK